MRLTIDHKPFQTPLRDSDSHVVDLRVTGKKMFGEDERETF